MADLRRSGPKNGNKQTGRATTRDTVKNDLGRNLGSENSMEIGAAKKEQAFRQSRCQVEANDSTQLKTDMPRWNIGNDDLADLIVYLKTLPSNLRVTESLIAENARRQLVRQSHLKVVRLDETSL